MIHQLGAIPLSQDILAKANIGLWAFELDEDAPARMYVDDTMLGLIGLTQQVSPEETYHAWYDHIDEGSYGLVAEAVEKMVGGEHAEVQYPWHHPDGRTFIVRCGGVRNPQYTKGVRIEGTHQNVTAVLHFNMQREIARQNELQYKHLQFSADVLDYFTSNQGDPTELLNVFAQRLLELTECDQIIYRDLEKVRVRVNSPHIDREWFVNEETCKHCPHHDVTSPVYEDSYTEMADCTKGFKGIVPNTGCPVRSMITRIVYNNGKPAGYLAMHYVQKAHDFSDLERKTLQDFAKLLSMAITRYQAQQDEAKAQKKVKESNRIIQSFCSQYNNVFTVSLSSNDSRFIKRNNVNVEGATHNLENAIEAIQRYIDSEVYEPDRAGMHAIINREQLQALTADTDSYRYEYRANVSGTPLWHEVMATKVDDDTLLVGMQNKDNAILYNHIDAILHENFEGLYVVNLATDQMKVLKGAGAFKAYEGKIIPYRMTMQWFASSLEGNDRTFFEDLAAYGPNISKALDEEGKSEYVYHSPHFSAQPVWTRCEIHVLTRNDGEVETVMGGVTRIDAIQREKIRLQENLQEALSMAESANRAKSTFLNSMSHDIRTPMNAIIGYTGLAVSHIDNKEQVRDYLAKIGQSSKHLLAIINDVLDMSRIESGHMKLDTHPESLKDLVESVAAIAEVDAIAKRQHFRIDTTRITDIIVVCDKVRLNRVLINVLSNAVKYTPEGGKVTMTVNQKTYKTNNNALIDIVVRDNGIGMSEEFVQKIFDPFAREATSTVSGIPGTGLGMAISKNIIEMMGGKISVKSQPDKGTEVHVSLTFEVYTPTANIIPVSASATTHRDYHGHKILLVEDNSINMEISQIILEEAGFTVDTAMDGSEAVAIMKEAEQGEYDAILMDIQMPTMDGYEATRQIRAMHTPASTLPIIAMTANAFEEDRKLALQSGMDAHLSKPVDIEQLLTTLDKYI